MNKTVSLVNKELPVSVDVEICFLIQASSENVFINRRNKFDSKTELFSEFGEEDEEGGIWKIITCGTFENIEALKTAINKMKKYKWFCWWDMDIMTNDYKYLFSEGEWLC